MSMWLLAPEQRAGNGGDTRVDGPLDRLVHEQMERAERRRAAREQMQSSGLPPAEKIRAWERLHGLQLPHDPDHIVLRLVAKGTGLTLREVLNEQSSRRAALNAKKIASPDSSPSR
jgi:hypothetical protein